jgi:hypothetical protein
MSEEQPTYLSYLIRLWRENDNERLQPSGPTYRSTVEAACAQGGQNVWRATVESSLTGERLGFATLDDLFSFLRKQTKSRTDADNH